MTVATAGTSAAGTATVIPYEAGWRPGSQPARAAAIAGLTVARRLRLLLEAAR